MTAFKLFRRGFVNAGSRAAQRMIRDASAL